MSYSTKWCILVFGQTKIIECRERFFQYKNAGTKCNFKVDNDKPMLIVVAQMQLKIILILSLKNNDIGYTKSDNLTTKRF